MCVRYFFFKKICFTVNSTEVQIFYRLQDSNFVLLSCGNIIVFLRAIDNLFFGVLA